MKKFIEVDVFLWLNEDEISSKAKIDPDQVSNIWTDTHGRTCFICGGCLWVSPLTESALEAIIEKHTKRNLTSLN